MVVMDNINIDVKHLLIQLGTRLKEARLARNESQEVFGARIGLTRQTYSKMERGTFSVPIGYWLVASDMLGLLQSWQEVLADKKNLFEQFEKIEVSRKRASRNTARKQ